jgi:hypothetical protein
MIKTCKAFTTIVAMTGVVWGTCYVAPELGPCEPNIPATVENDCIEVRYIPKKKYCDSQDGTCGRTECSSYSAVIYRCVVKGTRRGNSCGDPWVILVNWEPTDKRCDTVVLSGDRCGHCPGS